MSGEVQHARGDRDHPLAHLHLTMVGGHGERDSGGESLKDVRHQRIDIAELRVVVIGQTRDVGDLVDAVVVRVDER